MVKPSSVEDLKKIELLQERDAERVRVENLSPAGLVGVGAQRAAG